MAENNDLREGKGLAISDISEVQKRIDDVYASMELTRDALLNELMNNSAVETFKEIKFGKIAKDPFRKVNINFIEMLNQSFSDIVVLKGVEYLMNKYKGMAFDINLGALNGPDILSDDGSVIAECFSVVSVFNNQKIKMDSDKLMKENKGKVKYIFFFAKEDKEDRLNDLIVKYPRIKYMRLNNDLTEYEEL